MWMTVKLREGGGDSKVIEVVVIIVKFRWNVVTIVE